MTEKDYPYFDSDRSIGIRAGDDWLQLLTFDDGNVPATLVPFANCSAVLQVRNKSGVLILQASSADGTIILGAADGTLTIDVPKASTDLTPGIYTYGLKITDADQRDLTWFVADFEIAKKVVY